MNEFKKKAIDLMKKYISSQSEEEIEENEEIELKEGQSLKVETGHVALFESTVSYDIQTVKGFKNIFFGGEGLFLTRLTGPGRIWLQTMPLCNLAQVLKPYFPSTSSSSGSTITFGSKE